MTQRLTTKRLGLRIRNTDSKACTIIDWFKLQPIILHEIVIYPIKIEVSFEVLTMFNKYSKESKQ